ncbi:MAG: SpoIIE family protein phosphatase [Clostridia bacterium]|nr:SpoIIE family protein phosphatase [Clostridia bacterium]
MCTDRNPLNLGNLPADARFIENIINGMYDWVRVLDRDDNILYINKAMAEAVGDNPVGVKCYKAIGRSSPCENCTSRQAVFNGSPQEKEEIIHDKIYSVMSSPIKNDQGEIVAVVEVLRDVTQTRKLQKLLLEQNKRLKDDLDMAKKLQCSLLPKEIPEDKMKFSFLYKPCETLGGDFLDIFMVDRDHAGIYIADVSGHGVPASMLTVFLRSTFNKKTISPAQALRELYYEFNKSHFDRDFYISVFYAVINLESKTAVYSNAGLNVCPIVFNTDKFEILMTPGIPISNWVEQPEYIDRTISLKSLDRIFLYTDGVIELKNSSNEQYGEERLLNILLKDTSDPAGTLLHIMDSACEFAGISNTRSIPDDITLALIELK